MWMLYKENSCIFTYNFLKYELMKIETDKKAVLIVLTGVYIFKLGGKRGMRDCFSYFDTPKSRFFSNRSIP